MSWDTLTPDEKLAKLLQVIEVSDAGVVRFKPLNPDGQPHQRFAVGPRGISVSDDDPDPEWYGSGNAYFGGRVGIQAAVGFHQSPDEARKDMSFAAKRWQDGQPSSLQVENNNIPDQIVGQFWQSSNRHDLLTEYVLWLTSGDSGRPGARNTTLRLDAVNDQGEPGAKVTAIEANVFGGDPDNHLIDDSGSSFPTPSTPREAVRQLYLTLLNREPDQGGWDMWTSHIEREDMTYDQVKALFMASAEYKALHP